MTYAAPNRWTANHIEKLKDRLGQLEKVVGAQNKIIAEQRRQISILHRAVTELSQPESADVSTLLAPLAPPGEST